MWNRRRNPSDTPELEKYDVDFIQYANPIEVLVTTRLPLVIRCIDFLDNPQNNALNQLIVNAKRIIGLATPNINTAFCYSRIGRFYE